MVAKLQLVISENNKVIDTVIKETSNRPASMIKSLEEFQLLVNAALTKLVENTGGSGDEPEQDEASDDDETDEISHSPKKRPRRRHRQKHRD